MFVFFGTTFNAVMINYLVRDFYEEFDKEVPKVLEKSRLTKWAHYRLFKDPDSNRLDFMATTFLILFPIVAGFLWYAIAFKQFVALF